MPADLRSTIATRATHVEMIVRVAGELDLAQLHAMCQQKHVPLRLKGVDAPQSAYTVDDERIYDRRLCHAVSVVFACSIAATAVGKPRTEGYLGKLRQRVLRLYC